MLKRVPFVTPDVTVGNLPTNMLYTPQVWNGQNGMTGTHGLTLLVNLLKYAPVRGLYVFESYMYVVCGDTVYKISTAWEATSHGTIGTSTGDIQMAANGTQLGIADIEGETLYYTDGSTLTQVSDADLPSVGAFAYQDTYGIVLSKGTGQFYISSNNDFSTWDALDFTSAEGNPDPGLNLLSVSREVPVFGSKSVETFRNTGIADFPFERIDGSFHESGLGAAASPAYIIDSIYWLADDWTVKTFTGYMPTTVSPPAVSKIIKGFTTKSDARGYTYTEDGFHFYALTFPTEKRTFLFNIQVGAVCNWASFRNDSDDDGRHRSNCYTYFNGKHVVGDYEDGLIYELSGHTDNGYTIRKEIISPPMESDTEQLFFSSFRMDMKSGSGITGGGDPQAMLSWSDDGSRTWGNEVWRGIGDIGEYEREVVWYRLGSSRRRIFKVAVSDPVEVTILGAVVDIIGGLRR